MKKIVAFLVALTLGAAAYAQTPEEIIDRMESEMEKFESEGMSLTMDLKIFLLGTISSTAYTLGDKARIEAEVMGKKVITWTDGQTEWTYESADNVVRIKNADPSKKSSEQDNAELLNGIADGYDVTLTRETADAWYIRCKKSRSNTNKDDPKKMDLVVAKGTYYPVSLSTEISGITVTLRNLAFHVTEKQVTFDRADFPDARIIDDR